MAFWCLEFCNGKVVLSTVGVQIPLFPRGRVDERMDAAERGCDVLHQIFRCEIRTDDGENGHYGSWPQNLGSAWTVAEPTRK